MLLQFMKAFLPPEGTTVADIRKGFRHECCGRNRATGKLNYPSGIYGAFYPCDTVALISALEAVRFRLCATEPGAGLAACVAELYK